MKNTNPLFTWSGFLSTVIFGIIGSILMVTGQFMRISKIFFIVMGAIILLMFIVNIIGYSRYVRQNRKKVDYYNNKPTDTKWWHCPVAWTLGFLWYVWVIKKKEQRKSETKKEL